eukprot:TRINITY_DN5890_c0_g1_i2.p1 TRINITY_DN5890_c0_g1~~TRINITY_DN5890_c0_g1_i2.p1  ORF type:complete len:213 (+),score=27.45 TRINITY_DN5890_c0_g1_i2:44-682(+)
MERDIKLLLEDFERIFTETGDLRFISFKKCYKSFKEIGFGHIHQACPQNQPYNDFLQRLMNTALCFVGNEFDLPIRAGGLYLSYILCGTQAPIYIPSTGKLLEVSEQDEDEVNDKEHKTEQIRVSMRKWSEILDLKDDCCSIKTSPPNDVKNLLGLMISKKMFSFSAYCGPKEEHRNHKSIIEEYTDAHYPLVNDQDGLTPSRLVSIFADHA